MRALHTYHILLNNINILQENISTLQLKPNYSVTYTKQEVIKHWRILIKK